MTIRDLFVPFRDELQLRPTPRFPHPPTIEWCAEYGDLFLRPKGADPQLLWCDVGYTVTPKRPLPAQRRTTLSKRISPTFRGCSFFRVVPFPDGDEYVLVRPKRLLVKSTKQKLGSWWEWHAEIPTERKTQRAWLSQDAQWFQNWLKERCSKDGRVAHIRAFAALSEEERAWAPVVAPPEERQKWHELVRSLQIVMTPSGDVPPPWRYFVRPGHGKEAVLYLESKFSLAPTLGHEASSAAVWLRTELMNHFVLPVEQWRWRGLDQWGQKRPYHSLTFTLEVVSAHEKMEAALLWQEFGQEIGKSAEVEAAVLQLMS